MTSEDAATIPSDALSARQGACIQRESKITATRGSGCLWLGSAPRAGGTYSSGFQYLTVPLHKSTGRDRSAAETVAGVLLGTGWAYSKCGASYIGAVPEDGLCEACRL